MSILERKNYICFPSTDRLAELEGLISKYESADKSNKIAVGKEIVAEIYKLRKKYRKFKSHVEKPASIIGRMRGTEKTKAAGLNDIADYALEILQILFSLGPLQLNTSNKRKLRILFLLILASFLGAHLCFFCCLTYLRY